MKLKQLPADFRVDEITDCIPGSLGDYTLYRLEKTGWTTPDAVQVVRRRWKVDGRRVSWGGLKDRHAQTTQHITIFRGPKSDLDLPRLRLTCLGRVTEPFTATSITSNRFGVTVRDLSNSEARSALGRVEGILSTGVPNYFDDQRFGSVGSDGQFIARAMIGGDFDLALKLALTAPYEHDRAPDKREKATLTEHWGDWCALKFKLPKGHARSLICYLTDHPTDFKGAVARLRPELQGLYLSAYQSHLWNRVLDRWIRASVPASARAQIRLQLGPVSVPIKIPADMVGTERHGLYHCFQLGFEWIVWANSPSMSWPHSEKTI